MIASKETKKALVLILDWFNNKDLKPKGTKKLG
jgi:hypothetical protein